MLRFVAVTSWDLIGRRTINIQEIISGVHAFMVFAVKNNTLVMPEKPVPNMSTHWGHSILKGREKNTIFQLSAYIGRHKRAQVCIRDWKGHSDF